jgi:hypothetical protein
LIASSASWRVIILAFVITCKLPRILSVILVNRLVSRGDTDLKANAVPRIASIVKKIFLPGA